MYSCRSTSAGGTVVQDHLTKDICTDVAVHYNTEEYPCAVCRS
jgi:hypothetical protein